MPPRKLLGARQAAKLASHTDRSKVDNTKTDPALGDKRLLTGARANAKALGTKSHSISQTITDKTDEERIQDQKLYRSHLLRLFLRNKVSGKDTQEQAFLSGKAGALGVHDLGAAGKEGRHHGNSARDILRKAIHGNPLPEPYYADVPCHDPLTGKNKIMMTLPFLLVHEMIWFLLVQSKRMHVSMVTSLKENSGALARHLKICALNKSNPKETVPLGLHGDGVPWGEINLWKYGLGIS